MSTPAQIKNAARISLDAWAVLLALVAVFLVRFGLIKHISW